MPDQSPPPDWIVPKTTIAVAAIQRTGSNYLGEMMQRTGCLGQPLEYFHPAFLQELHGRRLDVADRFRLLAERGMSPNGVAAVKFFPPHFRSLARQTRIADWLGTPRWVLLRRRDLLAQAISFVMARQSGAYESFAAALAEPVYDGKAILGAIEMIVSGEGEWRSYFARNGLTPLELFYEDIEADPALALARVAALADVDLAPDHQAVAELHQRQADGRNAEWRSRFLAEYGNPELMARPVPRQRKAARPKPPPSLLRRLRRRLGL